MAFDPKTDIWIPPCDLCGSFRHETIELSAGETARRCLDCGLVSLTLEGAIEDEADAPFIEIPQDLLAEFMKDAARKSLRSTLVIGVPGEPIIAAAAEAGCQLKALLEPDDPEIPGVLISRSPLEHARFVPDEFDMILVTRGLENFAAPSLLFDRTRHWLSPGSPLLVGALNFDSLPAKLRRRNWLLRYSPAAHHLLSIDTIKGYARRYGFDVRSVRTRSQTGEVAAVVTGSESPSWFAEMAMSPLALACSLLGMGVLVVVQMTKGGMAMRPILKDVEEAAEDAPGLAPAMYAGVRRESVVA